MLPRISLVILVFASFSCTNSGGNPPSAVLQEEGKVFIVDRAGEKWDVTQAALLGFRPENFQYGIGRNAFTPLDDSELASGSPDLPDEMRVIGITGGGEARAYSVGRLKRHEVANSILGKKPVAVGY